MEDLIKSLQNKQLFSHPIDDFKVLQTHISWVILTGSYAYKIKKPVNFGFLDFTSVEKRRHFCQLEVELNRRLAPDLYIEVLPIRGTQDNPSFEGNGEIIDYAIKMRQFKQENLLLTLAAEKKLTDIMIQDIARQLAIFHRKAKKVDASESFGTFDSVYAPIEDNFSVLRSLDCAKGFTDELDIIHQWAQTEGKRLKPLIEKRKEQGFTRACHGDVHLGNIVMYSGKPLIFDCIEFNEDFRLTDTMNDLAFMAMDLEHKGYAEFANLLINTYAEWANDYDGIALLRYYQSYRAMVRAKVSALQIDTFDKNDPNIESLKQDLATYIALAKRYTQKTQAKLTITVGPSGSGKSVYSKQFMMKHQAIRVRSDVIRKHLFDVPPFKTPPEEIKPELYSTEASEKTFAQLQSYAKNLLQQNLPVIVDATFIKKASRDQFIQLGKTLNVPIEILHFDIPVEALKSNIIKRQQAKLNPSDADINVMLKQMDEIDPLTTEELKFTKTIHHEDLVALLT